MHAEMRIDSVETDRGTYTISGQTVTFFIPVLSPGETVQMRINTTVLGSPVDGQLVNTATLSGGGQTRTASATVNVPTHLPGTGYPPADNKQPSSDQPMLLAGIGAVLLVAGLIGRMILTGGLSRR